MNNEFEMSLEQATQYIRLMDFNQIIDKLVHHMGWSLKHAREVCEMYRRFLFLIKKYGHLHTLPPSEDIDEFWHMHILDTKRYRKDCEIIFGYYLDHYPYLGIDNNSTFKELEQAFAKTQELYALEFDKRGILQVRSTGTKIREFVRTLTQKKPKRIQVNSI